MGQGKEVPKFVIAIQYFCHFIGILLALIGLPTQAYLLFVVNVFGRKSLYENTVVHLLLWFFRWLFSNIAYLFWVGQAAVIGYYLYVATQSLGISIGVAIAFGVASILGMVYIVFGCVKKYDIIQIKWTEDTESNNMGYWRLLYKGWIDFFTFLFFLVAVATVFRIPCLVIAYYTEKKSRNWTSELFRQMFLGLLDLLLLPFYILGFVFFWRTHYMWTLWKKDTNTETPLYDFTISFIVRWVVVKTFLQVLLDIPTFLLAFTFFLITPWRFYYCYEKLTKVKSMNRAREEIGYQLALSLLDALCYVPVLVILGTIYRFPMLVLVFARNKSATQRRTACWFLFGVILFDLLVLLPCSILIMVTGYRFPKLLKIMMKNSWCTVNTNGKLSEPEVHYETFFQFLFLLRDIPFILMAIFVTALLWRAPMMWIDVLNKKKGWDRCVTIALHFGLLFLDILDLPFVFSCLIIMVTMWRSVALVKEMKKAFLVGRNQMRLIAIQQILLWFWDIPTGIAFFFILITGYRLYDTLQKLEKLRRTYFSTPPAVAAAIPPGDEEENPAPMDRSEYWSWHVIVWNQFALMLLDLPIAFLSIFTLWRLPFLIQKLATECDSAQERRIAVLLALYKTFKDILVFKLFLILCLSWRIVSVVKLIKSYKQGDDEHLGIMILFLEYLKDFPFFLLFVIDIPFVWRSIPLVLYLIFLPNIPEDEQEIARRKGIGFTTLIILLDLIMGPLTILLFCFFWRISSYVEVLQRNLPKADTIYSNNPYAKTFVWYLSTLHILLLSFSDLLTITHILLIFGCVLHVPSYIRRCYFIIKNLPIIPIIIDPNSVKQKDLDNAKEQSEIEGVKWPSLTIIRVVTVNEVFGSLRDFPHLFLLPIKIVGLIFLPFHIFMTKRIESKKSISLSFLKIPLLWLQEVSQERNNFWGFHQFAILNCIGSIIIIPNYLAMIIVAINSFLVFLCTFGEPIWKSLRETFGYLGLGTGEGCCGVLDTILLVSNLIWTPILLLVQFILFFLPLWLSVIMTLPYTSITDYFYVFFHRPDLYWTAVSQIPGWMWVVFFYWVVTMVAAEHLTLLHIAKYYSLFNPLTAVMWLLKKVLAGRLWRLYKALLAVPTRWAYKNKDTCGCLGEILIAPIILIWFAWPVVIPCVIQIYWNPQGWYFWILSVFMMIFFFWHGIVKKPLSVIRLNWRTHVKVQVSPYPMVLVKNIHVSLPDNGGFQIKIQGEKSGSIKVEQSLLYLEGIRSDGGADAFWSSLNRIFGSKLISMGRVAMYPIKLVPNFLKSQPFLTNSEDIDFSIVIPPVMTLVGKSVVLKKSMIEQTFQKIVAEGDPEVEFILEYTSRPIKEGAYKKHGYIVRFKTKFSSILSETSSSTLQCTFMNREGNWVAPLAIPSKKETKEKGKGKGKGKEESGITDEYELEKGILENSSDEEKVEKEEEKKKKKKKTKNVLESISEDSEKKEKKVDKNEKKVEIKEETHKVSDRSSSEDSEKGEKKEKKMEGKKEKKEEKTKYQDLKADGSNSSKIESSESLKELGTELSQSESSSEESKKQPTITLEKIEDSSSTGEGEKKEVKKKKEIKRTALKLSNRVKSLTKSKKDNYITIRDTSPSSVADEVPMDILVELMGMGFSKKQVEEALSAYPGNKEGAANYLLSINQ